MPNGTFEALEKSCGGGFGTFETLQKCCGGAFGGFGGAKRHLRNHLQGVAEPLVGLEMANRSFETLEKSCGGALGG